MLKVGAHRILQAVTVESNDIGQVLGAEDWVVTIFLFGNDLEQDRARNVAPGFFVHYLKFLALHNEVTDFIQGDVAAYFRVVQPAIGVFLNQARFRLLRVVFSSSHSDQR